MKMESIPNWIVAISAIFAVLSWRSDKLFDQALSTLSLLLSVKDAFERITTPKWNYGTPIAELRAK